MANGLLVYVTPSLVATEILQGLGNQPVNTVLAGPSSGATALAAFRILASSDIPGLDASKIISGILAASTIPGLDVSKLISGILAVARGGTGKGSYTTGSLPFFDGTVLNEDNANLFWDSVNKRLGIKTAAPALAVAVAAGAIGLDNGQALQIKDSGGTYRNVVLLDSGANVVLGAGSATGAVTPSADNITPLGQAATRFGTLYGAGGLSLAVATKTAAYTVTANDYLVIADATGAAFTVTLPAASSLAGKKVVVVKKDASANAVTVAAAGTDTIQGAASKSLAAQFNKVELISDGVSQWYDEGTNTI